MQKKEKIFLGGALFGEKEQRKRIAGYARKIEQLIKESGYEPSLNLLVDQDVYRDKQAKDKDIRFSDGSYFVEIGDEIIKASRNKVNVIKGIRHYDDEDKFILCCMAAGIMMKELTASIGGIFELSGKGSKFEIALLAYHFQKPALCLSHQEFGSGFGTILTGIPNPFIKTVKYDEHTLENIVKTFLTKELPEKKSKTFSYRMPVWLNEKLKSTAKTKGMSPSELIRRLLEENL